jgi:1-acyl-sn-glycerol-3-phosphate acyltransferase
MLSERFSLLIYPGGAEEALYVDPDTDVAIMKENLGIVRLALRNGVPIVPCYCFNEANNWKPLRVSIWIVDLFRKVFQKLTGISLPLVSNIFPYPSKCTLVIGKPIYIEQKIQFSRDDVHFYTSQYRREIQRLHEEYSPLYSMPNTKSLKIWSK